MKVRELFEKKEEQSVAPIDMIAYMLFKQKSGPVKDVKRSKEAEFIGVANTHSVVKTSEGKALKITFDNSTDSGEFEIDSLSKLRIEKNGDLDKKIKKLYSKHEVASKKKTTYIVVADVPVIKELHLGKNLTRNTVKLVRDFIALTKVESTKADDTPVETEENEEDNG